VEDQLLALMVMLEQEAVRTVEEMEKLILAVAAVAAAVLVEAVSL
jgi:hypothetical protein